MSEKRLYYVTVRDGGQTGFLLGPYKTHEESLAEVNRGRDLACEAVEKAWFYSFGTASLPSDIHPRVVFADKKEVTHV